MHAGINALHGTGSGQPMQLCVTFVNASVLLDIAGASHIAHIACYWLGLMGQLPLTMLA